MLTHHKQPASDRPGGKTLFVLAADAHQNRVLTPILTQTLPLKPATTHHLLAQSLIIACTDDFMNNPG